jgi:hypothetical protein
MDLRPLSPLEEFFYSQMGLIDKFFDVYFWLLYVFGALVCLWAFKRSKFKAYLVIFLYFLSPFWGVLQTQISRTIHKEEWERIVQEQRLEFERNREAGIPVVTRNSIVIPVFETFLVLGITLLAFKPSTANKALGENSEPLRDSESSS